MRCSRLVLAVTAIALTTSVPPAGAAATPGLIASPGSATDAPCTAEFDLTLNPGLSTTPASGTFTTGGETADLICTGTVNGKAITGVGTFGEAGRYGTSGPLSCTQLVGESTGQRAFTLPTANGPVHLVDSLHEAYGPLQGGGVVGGTHEGPRFRGTFNVLPLEGNCAVTPITKVRVSLRGRLVDKP